MIPGFPNILVDTFTGVQAAQSVDVSSVIGDPECSVLLAWVEINYSDPNTGEVFVIEIKVPGTSYNYFMSFEMITTTGDFVWVGNLWIPVLNRSFDWEVSTYTATGGSASISVNLVGWL